MSAKTLERSMLHLSVVLAHFGTMWQSFYCRPQGYCSAHSVSVRSAGPLWHVLRCSYLTNSKLDIDMWAMVAIEFCGSDCSVLGHISDVHVNYDFPAVTVHVCS